MFLTIMLALHVVGVVLWIGGVGMVTAIILPAARSESSPSEGMRLFQVVEHRFAPLARWLVLLVGLTGVAMLWQLDLWDGFSSVAFWWLHAMVLLWLIFAAILFVIEPLTSRRRRAPNLRRMQWLHALLLAASLLTIAGVVAGSHGVSPFG
ncbi:MAG: hypothetical protein ABI369_07945 [Acetobacteraceae bacterium]